MTTKKTSHAHVTSTSAASTASSTPSTVASSPAPVLEAGASSPTAVAAPAPAAPLFLQPPPASANIPAVPSSFLRESGADYRGTAPKKAELVALPLAVADLRKFTDYAQTIGATAPAYDAIVAMFEVTNEWSSMRTASAAWDAFSQDQEGMCWRAMRQAMDRLRPAFELAVTGNPSLSAKFAGLTTLLGAKQAIAKKAVSTKRLNKKAVSEGKEPTHGQVGKQRKKAADKAIVAAATSAATSTGAATAAPQGSVSAAPVVTATVPATPVAAAAPITNGASPVAAGVAVNGAGGVNGAAH